MPRKTQKKSGSRFHNVGEDLYPGSGTHEDGIDTRRKLRKSAGRRRHSAFKKTRKLRRKL